MTKAELYNRFFSMVALAEKSIRAELYQMGKDGTSAAIKFAQTIRIEDQITLDEYRKLMDALRDRIFDAYMGR